MILINILHFFLGRNGSEGPKGDQGDQGYKGLKNCALHICFV